MSKREDALNALHTLLNTALLEIDVTRNETEEKPVSKDGYATLQDGEAEEPETLLSPPRYEHEQVAGLIVIVQGKTSADRDAQMDQILEKVSNAILADRTLGGLVDFCEMSPPNFDDEVVDGGLDQKGALVRINLSYISDSPLG